MEAKTQEWNVSSYENVGLMPRLLLCLTIWHLQCLLLLFLLLFFLLFFFVFLLIPPLVDVVFKLLIQFVLLHALFPLGKCLISLHGGVGHGFIFVVRHGGAFGASGPLAKSRYPC